MKLLCKYEGKGLWVPLIRAEHQRIENSQMMGGIGLKGKEIVNLWLNSVFAHNNLKQKYGNPKLLDRNDFDRYDNKFGHARFEYSFRLAVRRFGRCYRNLLQLVARPALQRWEKAFGLKPSFQIGAPFGFGIVETTKDGVAIIRRPSTEYGSPESPEQKLVRILSRNEFDSLNSVFNQLNSQSLLASLTQAQTYCELLTKNGFEIKIDDDISFERINQELLTQKIVAVIPCRDYDNIFEIEPVSVFYKGKKLITQQRANDFFERKFARLKKLLAG